MSKPELMENGYIKAHASELNKGDQFKLQPTYQSILYTIIEQPDILDDGNVIIYCEGGISMALITDDEIYVYPYIKSV